MVFTFQIHLEINMIHQALVGIRPSQTEQEENVKFSINLNDKLGRIFVRTIYTNQLNNNLKAMLDLNLFPEFW